MQYSRVNAMVSIQSEFRHEDDLGAVLKFGEVPEDGGGKDGEFYFSTLCPKSIKAWRKHTKATLKLVCPAGSVRVLIFPERAGSIALDDLVEVKLCRASFKSLVVPPSAWVGFQNLAESESVVAVYSSIPHDPRELERRDHLDQRFPIIWD
jgi:dTDP-4-dehydrorhamnose 3,5-epimerase